MRTTGLKKSKNLLALVELTAACCGDVVYGLNDVVVPCDNDDAEVRLVVNCGSVFTAVDTFV